MSVKREDNGGRAPGDRLVKTGNVRFRRGLLVAALALALCVWAGWNVVQTRVAVARSPAARAAAAGCMDVEGSSWIYRITLVGHGALCSALMHQDTFYSYAIGRVVPAHWSRLDCAVTAAHGAAYCSEHRLATPAEWANLAGPPAPEVTALTVMSVR